MTVKEIIAWVVSSGGAMAIAYWLVDKVRALANLNPEPKRYAAFALAFAVANGFYFIGCAMGYTAWPVTVIEWIEIVVLVGSSAIVGSQTIHARRELRERAR